MKINELEDVNRLIEQRKDAATVLAHIRLNDVIQITAQNTHHIIDVRMPVTDSVRAIAEQICLEAIADAERQLHVLGVETDQPPLTADEIEEIKIDLADALAEDLEDAA